MILIKIKLIILILILYMTKYMALISEIRKAVYKSKFGFDILFFQVPTIVNM